MAHEPRRIVINLNFEKSNKVSSTSYGKDKIVILFKDPTVFKSAKTLIALQLDSPIVFRDLPQISADYEI